MSVGRLSPAQVRDLDAALRSAFPERSSLARMVRLWLGESLDEIVSPGSLKESTYNLISWAESRDRVTELIGGALAENPTNGRLRTLADELGVALPTAEAEIAPVRPRRPIMLQALLGSKSCTVSIMLGLALLIIIGATSSTAVGWITSLLPFPATATPIVIHVPTVAPSVTLQPSTVTVTPLPLVVTAVATDAPTPLTQVPTTSAPTVPTSLPAAKSTLTAIFTNVRTATAQAIPSAAATQTPTPSATPPRLPAPSAPPTLTAALSQTPVNTATTIPLKASATPGSNPVSTATPSVPQPVPPFSTAAVTPSLTKPPTATPSPTLLPAGTPCPWTLPVSGYTGGVYARPAVGRRLGCSAVNYEVGVAAAAIQTFQRGYLFRDSVLDQIFVLVRQPADATQGSWRVYPDPLPTADTDPGASLIRLLTDQPTVARDLGTALETPQARLQSGDQFHAAAQPFTNGYLLWADQPYPVFALYSDSRHWDAYNLP